MTSHYRKLFVIIIGLTFCLTAATGCKLQGATSLNDLYDLITAGSTASGVKDRVLIVDVRNSQRYIQGHIQDALTVPLGLIADESRNPLYTNGYDEVSATAATGIANSWLCHMLVNQLVNDYVSTYENSRIIFYGDTVLAGKAAASAALAAGYKNVSFLASGYTAWKVSHPGLTVQYYEGVESINETDGTFVLNGYINNTNFENITTKGTHNCIIYEGGASHNLGIFQVITPPFCFQEMLTHVGVNPEGNMADGIDFGDAEEWSYKHVDGQQVSYSITWNGAPKNYALAELFEEKPSAYQPDPGAFVAMGIEPRVGGTRDSNVNWNPGCIYCSYSCVCGITSNAKVNDATWYADGGIYDLMNNPDDPRNYYAGRFYPRTDLLPPAGTAIKIRVSAIK